MPTQVSAAGVARTISRILRKNGFLMADTSDRYRWTEGFHVSRIGYSHLVSVDYYVPYSTLNHDSRKVKRREQRARARQFLLAKGYTLDERQDVCYIVCQSD